MFHCHMPREVMSKIYVFGKEGFPIFNYIVIYFSLEVRSSAAYSPTSTIFLPACRSCLRQAQAAAVVEPVETTAL